MLRRWAALRLASRRPHWHGARGHRMLRGAKETAQAGQQRDGCGDAGGGHRQPPWSATQMPQHPGGDHVGGQSLWVRVCSCPSRMSHWSGSRVAMAGSWVAMITAAPIETAASTEW